jgi:outer membrane protein assembly factor BamD
MIAFLGDVAKAFDLQRLRAVAVALFMGLAVSGCALFTPEAPPLLPDDPADRLYNEGVFLMNSRKDYAAAAKKFEELDRQHPYSDYSRRGLVLMAFSYYEIGRYDEAIEAGRRYVQLHPGTQEAAYAQYIVAASYFDQIPDITRDQQRTERALQALDEVVRRYPQSEYASAARKKMDVARDQLAGKEMAVGLYYLKQRNFIGAINRYKTVVTQYQTTRHVEEALMRLTEAYMALGIVNEAQTAAAVLGHNFPDSQWYRDAYKLVQTGGLEPREDRGSWISRAMRSVGLNAG